MYFDHAFQKLFVGTHATQAETFVGGAGTALVHAGIDKGFLTSEYTTSGGGGGRRLKTSDLQSYAMGPGTFGFFDKNYDVLVATDFPGVGCCPLYLVAASIRTSDKLGPFHGGYQESTKSKLINPKYVRRAYRVDPCVPQQAVVSIGSTPYTNTGIATVHNLTAGTGYTTPGTYYDVALTGGTGSGVRATVVVIAGGGGSVSSITITNAGTGYTAADILTVPASIIFVPGAAATIQVWTVSTISDAACCKEFLCGETYYLRIDVKGSPTLRALNHNAYQTVSAYGGCCSGAVPTAIDPTLIYLQWANQIIVNAYLKDFVAPVVFDYTGVAWYAPGTTVSYDGLSTPVAATQWWGTEANLIDNYTASAQALAWTGAVGQTCDAGMRLYGAFVSTTFLDCTFQVTDHFEKEPIKILASEVDYTGDVCIFEGLCVHTECLGVQGMGFGEQAIRDLILSESYLQNFFHSDLRIREITGGIDDFAVITRSAQYYRYCILHSVPRFNNPTGVFDNDQYLLEVVTTAVSTSLETFLTAWFAACVDCVTLETESCTRCTIIPG